MSGLTFDLSNSGITYVLAILIIMTTQDNLNLLCNMCGIVYVISEAASIC